MIHLLLNREDDTLVVVSHETFTSVFATDNVYVDLEVMQQLTMNGITLRRVIAAFEEFFRTQGYQQTLSIDVNFNPDELESIQKAVTTAIKRGRS